MNYASFECVFSDETQSLLCVYIRPRVLVISPHDLPQIRHISRGRSCQFM